MTSSSIKDYESVLAKLRSRSKDLETFTNYAPRDRFREASITDGSLSFSVVEEDGSIFSMAIGQNPRILDCDRLATTRAVLVDLSVFEYRIDWDTYAIDTADFAKQQKATPCSDDNEIKEFLETHAPTSSVWPEHPEIILWGQTRESEELVAIGALVRWRTGQVMFASIATHSDYRGRGFAQKLVKEMLSSAFAMGINRVGLGVFAKNVAAKQAYERVGFEVIYEFSSYAKI